MFIVNMEDIDIVIYEKALKNGMAFMMMQGADVNSQLRNMELDLCILGTMSKVTL